MNAIAGLLIKLLTGPLVQTALDIFERAQRAKMDRAAIEAELKRAIAAELGRLATTELQARRDVLIAELRGESPIQRYWRPVVALTAFFSYWFVIIAYPFLHAWGLLPQVRFGEVGLQNMFWLTTVAVGGYIGGRTLEKVMRLSALP